MLDLIRSQKFIAAVLSLAVMVLVTLVPDLKPLEEAILDNLVALAALLVAGMTLDTAIGKWLSDPQSRALVDDLIERGLAARYVIPIGNGKRVVLDVPDEIEDDAKAIILASLDRLFGTSEPSPEPNADGTAG